MRRYSSVVVYRTCNLLCGFVALSVSANVREIGTLDPEVGSSSPPSADIFHGEWADTPKAYRAAQTWVKLCISPVLILTDDCSK